MEITFVPIDTLIPYALNNVNHSDLQVDRLANSIREFGFNVPIVVSRDNIIIAGHGRLMAARKLGLKEVPIIKKDELSAAQEKAYRILDNKLARDSEWNFDNIRAEFEFLEENNFQFDAFGLKDILPPLRLPTSDDEFEPSEFDKIKTLIKLGDLIELGPHKVLCGDSTNESHVAQLLGSVVPFIMVTDPPYGVGYDPEWRNNAINDLPSKAVGKVSNDGRFDWKEAYQLFPGSVAYVWHGAVSSGSVGLNLIAAGFEIRNQIIWRKTNFAMSRGHYHWQHEPCWYAVREKHVAKWKGDKRQSTIWDITNTKDKLDGTCHSTQKPLELMARPIRNHGGKEDDVYDPFLGSGTTLIACSQLDRRCFGLEIEPKYCQVIIDRYKNHCEHMKKEFKCFVNGEPYVINRAEA